MQYHMSRKGGGRGEDVNSSGAGSGSFDGALLRGADEGAGGLKEKLK